ncbi:glutathione S-transferase T2-like [Carex rostrata]
MDPNRPPFNPYFNPYCMNSQRSYPEMPNMQFPFNSMYQSPQQGSSMMPPPNPVTQDQPTANISPQIDAQTINSANEVLIQKQKSKERLRWSPTDDLKLCGAWLLVSKDPVTGKDQSDKSFWKRIYKEFVQSQNQNSERSMSAVVSRWQKLSHAVSKFSGCIKKIHDRGESGLSEDDKKNRALELYHHNEGEIFAFMHAWDVLKKEEKWLSQYVNTKDTPSTEHAVSKRSKTNTSNSYTSTEDSDTVISERPPGRKFSKAKGKQKEVSAREIEQKKEALEAQHNVELQKIEKIDSFTKTMEGLCKEIKRVHNQNFALKFMELDTSTMTEDQKKVYDKTLESVLSDD